MSASIADLDAALVLIDTDVNSVKDLETANAAQIAELKAQATPDVQAQLDHLKSVDVVLKGILSSATPAPTPAPAPGVTPDPTSTTP